MNAVDGLLLVLLVPFALRGYWRGFCREGAGLLGLVGGIFAAVTFGPEVATGLVKAGFDHGASTLWIAWALLFVVTFVAAAVVGRLAERLAQAIFLGGVNRVAGLMLGCAKGAAVLAFGLLVVQQMAPRVRPAIAASRVGGPLTQLATRVLQDARPAERAAREAV